MNDFDRSTVQLTHYGRRSGKPFTVTIWFVVLDGQVWIGSLNRDRSWVRNVLARGTAELDFGNGPRTVHCLPVEDTAKVERFSRAILVKYPVQARLIGFITRLVGSRDSSRCAFETDLAVAGDSRP